MGDEAVAVGAAGSVAAVAVEEAEGAEGGEVAADLAGAHVEGAGEGIDLEGAVFEGVEFATEPPVEADGVAGAGTGGEGAVGGGEGDHVGVARVTGSRPSRGRAGRGVLLVAPVASR